MNTLVQMWVTVCPPLPYLLTEHVYKLMTNMVPEFRNSCCKNVISLAITELYPSHNSTEVNV